MPLLEPSLEVRFGVRNIGDLDANEVYLRLDGPGDDSSTYPSEGKITSLDEGESVRVTLYWWATEAGTHDVTLSLDPSQQYEDANRENNAYTFSFQIDPRPVEPMLRFLAGASRTQPEIPTPGVPFDIQIRLDNLGQSDATSLNIGLERYLDDVGSWTRLDDKSINIVPGSSTTSGYAFTKFADVITDPGYVALQGRSEWLGC